MALAPWNQLRACPWVKAKRRYEAVVARAKTTRVLKASSWGKCAVTDSRDEAWRGVGHQGKRTRRISRGDAEFSWGMARRKGASNFASRPKATGIWVWIVNIDLDGRFRVSVKKLLGRFQLGKAPDKRGPGLGPAKTGSRNWGGGGGGGQGGVRGRVARIKKASPSGQGLFAVGNAKISLDLGRKMMDQGVRQGGLDQKREEDWSGKADARAGAGFASLEASAGRKAGVARPARGRKDPKQLP